MFELVSFLSLGEYGIIINNKKTNRSIILDFLETIQYLDNKDILEETYIKSEEKFIVKTKEEYLELSIL